VNIIDRSWFKKPFLIGLYPKLSAKGERKMAHFLDLSFKELIQRAPGAIKEGLTGTKTMVFAHPEDPDRGFIIETNSTGGVLGTWPIVAGNAYRITPQKVRRMPLIERDTKYVRRFCRQNGIALTKIKHVKRGEEVKFSRPRNQGDDGIRMVGENDPPVCLVSVETGNNPSNQWLILVVKGEEPKTWEEMVKIAKKWNPSRYLKWDLEERGPTFR